MSKAFYFVTTLPDGRVTLHQTYRPISIGVARRCRARTDRF